jgi:hypothetical protein
MRALSLTIVLSHSGFGQEPAKMPECEVADVQVGKSTSPERGKRKDVSG